MSEESEQTVVQKNEVINVMNDKTNSTKIKNNPK